VGFLGGLEKMKISSYAKSDLSGVPKSFTVFINPEKYSHSYKICYNDVQAQGSSGGSPEFNKIFADTVKFELVFDGTGVVPAALPGIGIFTEDGITKMIADFKNVVFDYDGSIHSPRYLKLSWGTLLFSCRLTALDISYTLFKPDGTPLRARANATFLGYTDEDELAKLANKSSPDLTHVVTVKAGETLPLLCHRIYGSSTHYRKIAEVNGLTDFRALSAGQKLLFPPLRSRSQTASRKGSTG
jgi:hypothetical protein